MQDRLNRAAYLPNGQPNPRYLVVGHIVGRAEALTLGWTAAQINDLSNSQSECTDCSVRSGGEAGVRLRRTKVKPPVPIAAPEASHW